LNPIHFARACKDSVEDVSPSAESLASSLLPQDDDIELKASSGMNTRLFLAVHARSDSDGGTGILCTISSVSHRRDSLDYICTFFIVRIVSDITCDEAMWMWLPVLPLYS
jgi:hypothetical protein